MKILVVDDEKVLVKAIKFNLESEGYTVETAYDGEEALAKANDPEIDLVVLDLMLPKMDGLTVCQKVREVSNVPIIMLTAKADDTDKILGFEFGADDYLAKPFNITELKARIRAIMRRVSAPKAEGDSRYIEAGSVLLDTNTRVVTIGDKKFDLTAKEFDLLALLARNPGHVYSREKLLNVIWGYDYPGDVRTVDVHIHRIKKKIEENPSEPVHVMTKWGMGYYFNG